jgi:hypothetical protein
MRIKKKIVLASLAGQLPYLTSQTLIVDGGSTIS